MELLSYPVIQILIAAVIFISILAEIKTAGFSGGGLVAAVFGFLLIGSHWQDSAWQIPEVLLYFGGMALIFADLLFLATGAAAAAGLVSMAAALYFIFGADTHAMYVLALGILLSGAGLFFLAGHLSENRLWKKLTLSLSLSSQKGYVSSVEDLKQWTGKRGIARSVLRPAGKVEAEGRVLDAVTEGDFIEKGTPVMIVRAEGNRVVVRAAGKTHLQ